MAVSVSVTPPPAPAPAPVATPAPPPTPPAVAPPRPTQPHPHTVGVTPTGPLPSPPAAAATDRAAYGQWLASLSSGNRARIAGFCAKEHPLDYDERCGGIGPLHLPVPPSLIEERRPGEPSHDDWEASLTQAQAAYYHRHCRLGNESEAFSQLCGATPLVVSFDGAAVAFDTATDRRFAFRPGDPVATDWPTAATPWLALDRDGDGAITSGAELFGSSVQLADGTAAPNGFAALAELDANHDGRIDRDDPAFSRLALWFDRDGDRRSTPDELVPASSVLDAIDLDVTIVPRCTTSGDCERERATVHWHDAGGGHHAGAIVDVYLSYR